MASEQEEILNLFRSSGALLEGHFVLRSGLHSGHFFQCAAVAQYLDKITRLAELLLKKIGNTSFDVVLAPAMGGLVIGQEVARQAQKRYIFAEKINDRLELRRNFQIESGERVLIVEDVITRGGRVREALEIVRARGGIAAGVAILVDRSEGHTTFGEIPLYALLQLSFPTYAADALPAELAALPAVKPGS